MQKNQFAGFRPYFQEYRPGLRAEYNMYKCLNESDLFLHGTKPVPEGERFYLAVRVLYGVSPNSSTMARKRGSLRMKSKSGLVVILLR